MSNKTNLNYGLLKDSKIESDLEQLFLDQCSANLITHEFCSYQSLALWNALTKVNKYYLTQSEISLVSQVAPHIENFDCFVDLGPGSDTNAIAKSLPFIDALDINSYCPVDISPSFAYQAGQAIKQKRNHLSILPIIGDWEENALNQIPQGSLVYYSGGSIGNVPLKENENTLQAMQRHLSFLKEKMHDVSLLVTLDVNQDATSLEECYNMPLMKWFNHSLWQSFEELHQVQGLKSQNIQVYSKWDSINQRVCHIAQASKDISLCLNGNYYKWRKGQEFVQSHSMKPTVNQFVNVVEKSGWKVCKIFSHESMRIFYMRG